MELISYRIICKDLPEDKKKIFLKACINYFFKNCVSYHFPRRIIHYEDSLLSWKINRQHN